MNLPPEVLLLDDARKDFNEYAGAAHRSGCHEDVVSLRQDIQSLRQHNQSLQQKVDEQAQKLNEQVQKLNRQSQEIVLKVNVAELRRGGQVLLLSDRKMVGAYAVDMKVEKGYIANGNSCGVYLQLTDGPFPCRVSANIDVVNWDGVLESNHKVDFAHTYEHATWYGRNKVIELSELTEAGSPYVRAGHVTFITTFRILPLA